MANLQEEKFWCEAKASDRLGKAVSYFMLAFDDQAENRPKPRVCEFPTNLPAQRIDFFHGLLARLGASDLGVTFED